MRIILLKEKEKKNNSKLFVKNVFLLQGNQASPPLFVNDDEIFEVSRAGPEDKLHKKKIKIIIKTIPFVTFGFMLYTTQSITSAIRQLEVNPWVPFLLLLFLNFLSFVSLFLSLFFLQMFGLSTNIKGPRGRTEKK